MRRRGKTVPAAGLTGLTIARGGRGFAALIAVGVVLTACTVARPDPKVLCMQAYRVHWGRDWQQVEYLTTLALESDPEFTWAYSLRGVARTRLGRYEDAYRDLTRAIEINPNFVPAYTNRAITGIRWGKLEDSERDLQQALKLKPESIISLVTMAEVKAMQDDLEEACRRLTQAVTLGFRDLGSIEDNRHFFDFVYSDCYDQLVTAVLDRGRS